jgi:cytidine deaminase
MCDIRQFEILISELFIFAPFLGCFCRIFEFKCQIMKFCIVLFKKQYINFDGRKRMPSVPIFPNTNRQKQLISTAKSLLKYAYCPYSGNSFAAALLGENGVIYTGVSVENINHDSSLCAEHAAVAKAVSKGCRRFSAIAVLSGAGTPAFPCGSCRQVLSEFSPGVLIIIQDETGKIHLLPLSQLLPASFGVKVT